jgi:hypothetical protein
MGVTADGITEAGKAGLAIAGAGTRDAGLGTWPNACEVSPKRPDSTSTEAQTRKVKAALESNNLTDKISFITDSCEVCIGAKAILTLFV